MKAGQKVTATIDKATGKLSVHMEGYVGKECDLVANILKEFFGEPTEERELAEYHRAGQSQELRQNA